MRMRTCRLVVDRDTGKPKGYGFCEYFDIETAQSAMRNLNGYDINGRKLRVDFAEDSTKGLPLPRPPQNKNMFVNRQNNSPPPNFQTPPKTIKHIKHIKTTYETHPKHIPNTSKHK